MIPSTASWFYDGNCFVFSIWSIAYGYVHQYYSGKFVAKSHHSIGNDDFGIFLQEKLTDTFREASVKLKESFNHIIAQSQAEEAEDTPSATTIEVPEIETNK